MTRIIYIVFLVLLIVSTLLFIEFNEIGYFVLDDRPRLENIRARLDKELLRDSTVSGEFKSNFSNLGIIGIRFHTFSRINNDWLLFKIREKGATIWYYTAQYKTDQFQYGKIFPIGFPPIINSNHKIYEFELSSLGGIPGNAVAISSQYPNFLGRHVFTREMFLQNWKQIPDFIWKKIFNVSEYPNFSQLLLVYLTPFIFVMLFSLTNYSITISLSTIFYLVGWDIFHNKIFYDHLFLSIIASWWLVVRRHKLIPKISAIISIIFWVIVIITTLLGNYLMVEKATSWGIFFLLFTFIQSLSKAQSEAGFGNSAGYIFRGLWVEIRSFLTTIIRSNGYIFRGLWTGTKSFLFVLTRPEWKDIGIEVKNDILSLVKDVFLSVLVPTGIIFWLTRSIFMGAIGAFNAYQNYFPSGQTLRFFVNIGIYLIFLYLILLTCLIFFIKKLLIVNKLLILVITLALIYFLQSKIIEITNLDSSPIIWSVRGRALNEPWVDIFIDGRNFHGTPFKGKVIINGIEHRIMKWGDQEIIFRTDPYTTKSGKVIVIRDDGQASNSVNFLYYGNQ